MHDVHQPSLAPKCVASFGLAGQPSLALKCVASFGLAGQPSPALEFASQAPVWRAIRLAEPFTRQARGPPDERCR